ncbi:sulfatase [Polaribacter vadi]|uniref:sulfatase n=1 Tax=Polaribacter vadi TaxID=1774273 RepID=UPI0030EC556F|tara:strand:+ start:48105 stop:49676 length:1572 start_codon:yes stop_codon:yes gene_type:complete
MKYQFTKILCIFIYFGVLFNGFSQEKKPNIILIVVDDLNDYTGFLGGHPQVKTPNMDALANEGTVFTNAHTNAPICAPSRASMLTGIYPHVSQNFWFDQWTDNNVLKNSKSIGKFMGDNGYNTYATSKLMHHSVKSEWNEYGIENDFGPFAFNGKKVVKHPLMSAEYSDDKNDGLFMSLADVPNVKATDKTPGYNGWYDVKNKKPFRYVSDDDRDLVNDELSAEWAVEKLNNLNNTDSDKPFFMAVGFVRPHTPLVAPQKYFDMYPLETLKIPVIKKNDNEDTYYRTTFAWKAPWTQHFQELEASYKNIDDGLRKYVQAYLACVSFADAQIGKVMDALRSSKFNENTVVILVSDHGYNIGEKDFLYKNNLWEETTRIPMIIRDLKTKQSKGKRIHHPVSLIDVYPTIVDFSNIKANNIKNELGKPLSGFSLKPFLENSDNPKWNGPDVALTVVKGKKKSIIPDEQSYSVRSEKYRYILYFNGKEELYDHEIDPYEWTNLATDKKYHQIKADLKKQLYKLLEKK